MVARHSTSRPAFTPKPSREPEEDSPAPVSFSLNEDDKELYQRLSAKLRIDRNQLEDELVDQAEIFEELGGHLSLLISRRDAAKQFLSDTEAHIEGSIRKSARDQEAKTSAREVEAKVRVSANVQKAYRTFARLSYAVGQFAALKEAFQQRSYALSKIVDLYLAHYYSTTGTSRTGGEGLKTARADKARTEMSRMRHGGSDD